MALHLITGHAGYSHITSSDAAALLRGLAGNDTRTLGRAPSVSMSDANTLVVEPFDLVFQGRFVRSTATETVKIESGGQAAYRHDLVCLRYSTDDGGTEGVELVVIKGDAAASADGAVDPVPPNAGGDSSAGAPVDIPIVRVLLDGLAPAAEWLPPQGAVPTDPVVLYDNPNTGYKDSVMLSDNLANYREITIDFHALGNLTSSTRVYNPDGKFVPLSTVLIGSDKKIYINTKSVTLSGNSITTTKDSHGWVTGTASNGVATGSDSVAITRVVGWRK